jgi:hypothetical protein
MRVVYKLGEVCKWSQGEQGVSRYGGAFRYVDVMIEPPDDGVGSKLDSMTRHQVLELPKAEAEFLCSTMQAAESARLESATNTASPDTSPSAHDPDAEGQGDVP